MPNGIIIIDKPAGWTSMDVCIPRGPRPRGNPEIEHPRAE